MKRVEVIKNHLVSQTKHKFSKDSQTSTFESILLLNRVKSDNFYSSSKLTNHTVSALVALRNLKASEERLKSFYLNYSKRLKTPRPKSLSRVTKKNWKECLGKEDYFMDYFEFFAEEISHRGVVETV